MSTLKMEAGDSCQVISNHISRYSSVGIGSWTARVQFPTEAREFPLLHSVQTDSGSTQPPVQWEREDIFPEVKNCGDIPPLLNTSSWSDD
jgi:hypothetical protein